MWSQETNEKLSLYLLLAAIGRKVGMKNDREDTKVLVFSFL
jgi:hypothetical protein